MHWLNSKQVKAVRRKQSFTSYTSSGQWPIDFQNDRMFSVQADSGSDCFTSLAVPGPIVARWSRTHPCVLVSASETHVIGTSTFDTSSMLISSLELSCPVIIFAKTSPIDRSQNRRPEKLRKCAGAGEVTYIASSSRCFLSSRRSSLALFICPK